MIVPPVVSGLGFFYAYNTRAAMLLGTYIRTELWTDLQRHMPDRRPLPSWERFVGAYRQGDPFASVWMRARWMSLEAVGTSTVFLLPSLVALTAYGPGESLGDSNTLLVVWILDALLTTSRWRSRTSSSVTMSGFESSTQRSAASRR